MEKIKFIRLLRMFFQKKIIQNIAVLIEVDLARIVFDGAIIE